MNNQGNYQRYRGLVPPRPQYVTPVPVPVPVPSGGTLPSGQNYLSWSQSQRMPPPALVPPHGQFQTPRIPPPGQQFYRVQPPPRLPPPSSAYFTPAPPPGSFVLPPPPSAPPPGPPPLPLSSTHDNSHVIDSDVSPPPPRDENIVKKIEVLCQFIAKNGEGFEEMTSQKEVGNPDFEFLFGGAPGSEAAISHEYFKWMKRKCMLEEGHNRTLSLKPSEVDTLHEDLSHSPGGSDMDMEDDITHPEEPGVGNTVGNEKHEAAFISNKVDIKADSESTQAIGQGANNDTIGPNLSLNDKQFEKSKLMVGVAVSESSLDCKTEQENINLYQETNRSEQSPFRLIQGYASDDNSENDNDLHFENVSPVAVSPQSKEQATLPVPVVEGSLSITSKVSEPSIEKENLENRTDGGVSIEKNNHLEGDGISDSKNGGAQREHNNVKLKTDEFGRVVKRGGSDSDSDDYSTRRRVKRGRSRSRSRSPYERCRSRSPYGRWRRSPRRRERRSPSRSRSPRKRNRSRSPYSRRNTSQSQEICHDFRRGRCFRGNTCRYSHELEKSEESRWNKNKQYHREVPDRLKNSDKLLPEKNEVDYQVSRSTEPPGHSVEVASGHETEQPATETVPPPATFWNSLPPAPPRPQLGGPVPQYQLNPPSFQTNYPFQPFVTPYGPINYPILQQSVGPPISSPNLVSSNSRILSHYNPYASTFDQPLSTKFSSDVFNQDYGSSANQNHTPDEGQTHNSAPNPLASGGDQYDPLFDSIDPSSNSVKKTNAIAASEENEEFGETADAEVGAVENDSPNPSSPTDLPDMATREVEIDQVKNKKSKDSRSIKPFKIALAEFVKEVLKPSWRQGNMSKEAFKTIVKKTVDKVSGAMKKHQIPKSQTKINHYIDSSQRKLTKLVMGYVDKYVKV